MITSFCSLLQNATNTCQLQTRLPQIPWNARGIWKLVISGMRVVAITPM